MVKNLTDKGAVDFAKEVDEEMSSEFTASIDIVVERDKFR